MNLLLAAYLLTLQPSPSPLDTVMAAPQTEAPVCLSTYDCPDKGLDRTKQN